MTFFFLLTGRSPFKDGTLAQKLLYHRLQLPEPVTKFRSDVPADVATIIERMLAKDPAKRYQQPTEVLEALEPWTAAPLPPPPEVEMPRLSRAARRQPASGSEPISPLHSGARSTLHNRPVPTTETFNPDGGGGAARCSARLEMEDTANNGRLDRKTNSPCRTVQARSVNDRS